MAGVSDAALKEMTQEERVTALGMRTDQLTGRAMAISFDPDEKERFEYPWAPEVDFNKRTELDVDEMTSTEANNQIRALMAEGYGTIVIKNPRGKHSLGVGILSRLRLIFEGSLGYFGVGLLDGPNVTINGRVGWSCGENMMAGTIVVRKMLDQPLEPHCGVVIWWRAARLGRGPASTKRVAPLLWGAILALCQAL